MTNNDKNLAVMQNANVIPSPEEWGTIYNMAKALLPTGFLPNTIKTPEQATAIMLKGRELNVPPMQALSSIVIVQGKPTVSAELMLALVQRDHGISAMWVEESTNDYCTVGYRSGNGKKFYTFSMDDAKRANLTKNQTWTNYPAAMCRARAISAVARMAFPGSIAGMYVPGEIGDDVTVDEDGEVKSADVVSTHGEPDKWGPGTGGGPVQSSPPRVETSVTVESIDQDTGEVTELPSEPQLSAWEKANRRLHAVAAKHRLTHEDLHRMVVDTGGTSVRKASAAWLASTADKIEGNPEQAQAYAARLALEDAADATESDENGPVMIDNVDASPDAVQGEIIDIPAEDEAAMRRRRVEAATR